MSTARRPASRLPEGLPRFFSPELWSLAWEFARRDLHTRYGTTVLNFYWSVINPLVLLGIYTLVFGVILEVRLGLGPRVSTLDYGLFLFAGFVPWNAFHEAVSRSVACIVDQRDLVAHHLFPAEALPLSLAISATINALVAGLLVGAASLVLEGRIAPTFALYPLVLLLMLPLSFGLGCVLAVMNVHLRDVGQLANLLLMILMYLTPVFYARGMEAIPGWFDHVLAVNPMTYALALFRGCALDGYWFGASGPLLALLLLLALSAPVLWLGLRLFARHRHRFGDLT